MSGIVMWVSALAVAVALSFGLSEVGLAAVDAARAQTAADAAALAGAGDGEAAAHAAAIRNDARLIAIRVDGSIVDVIVAYRERTSSARAERILVPILD